jgi:hypothetical protein
LNVIYFLSTVYNPYGLFRMKEKPQILELSVSILFKS